MIRLKKTWRRYANFLSPLESRYGGAITISDLDTITILHLDTITIPDLDTITIPDLDTIPIPIITIAHASADRPCSCKGMDG